MIRVMLVDDHPIVLVGLKAGLEQRPDIHVQTEARDGETAIQRAAETGPDVALVDLRLPGIDGFETTQRLKKVSPSTRVILLSGWFDSRSVERALELGVSGFLLKYEAPARLAEAIRQVLQGQTCFSKEILAMLEPVPTGGYRLSTHRGAVLSQFSRREREMLKVLAEGCSLKQAARRLGLSYKSADHLKQGLMKKLEVHDRVDLVRFAIREGIVGAAETPPASGSLASDSSIELSSLSCGNSSTSG